MRSGEVSPPTIASPLTPPTIADCQVFAVWRLEPSRPSSPPTGRHRPSSKPSTPQPIGEADEGGKGGGTGASTPPPRSPQPPPQQRMSASSGSFSSSPPPSLDVDLLYHPIMADSDDSCLKELQKVSLCGWEGGGGRVWGGGGR